MQGLCSVIDLIDLYIQTDIVEIMRLDRFIIPRTGACQEGFADIILEAGMSN